LKIGPLNQCNFVWDKTNRIDNSINRNSDGEKQSADKIEISSKARRLYASRFQPTEVNSGGNKIDGQRLMVIRHRIREDYYSTTQVKDMLANRLSAEPEFIKAYNEARENIQE
jgi:hypothetical protein